MIISPAPVPNKFQTVDGVTMQVKKVDLPPWDMLIDSYKIVDIGVSKEKIMGLFVHIYQDDRRIQFYGSHYANASTVLNMYLQSQTTSDTEILITRLPNNVGSQFRDTSESRGEIYVWYII